MNSSNVINLTLDQAKSAFDSLNMAIVEHAEWLVSWNQNLICEQPITQELVKVYSARNCEFQHWLESTHSDFLNQLLIDVQVKEKHQRVHHCVEKILINNKQAQKTSIKQYDEYIDAERDFSSFLIEIRDDIYRHIFSFDFLTCTLSRQAIFQVISHEQARVNRSGEMSCIAFIDLDYFKKINDKHGHHIGDEVLVLIAEYFSSHLRTCDSIGRFGGEEFLICLPNTDLCEAQNGMRRLADELTQKVFHDDDNILIPTVSIGIAPILRKSEIKESIKNADQALYLAKSKGRNRVELWQD